jgi:murein L,D-transpeptidase YafK
MRTLRLPKITLTFMLLVGAAAQAAPAPRIGRVPLLSDPALPHVQYVLVKKSARRLYLMNGNQVVRSFRIHLGLMPNGPKERSGDYRTPVGWYHLVRRDPRSEFFLSIQISYPNRADRARARAHHWQPGGQIMIHGLPNHLHSPLSYYLHSDWTDGCIAVSDANMMQIWMMTRDGMPIDIQP